MSAVAASTTSELPKGVVLAPGETVVAARAFGVSNALFFVRWRMILTNRRLIGRSAKTLFGIIPVGSTETDYPLENIGGVTARRVFALPSVILSLLFLQYGLSGFIFLVLGLIILVSAVRARIDVTDTLGHQIAHGIALTDWSAAGAFVSEIVAAIDERASPSAETVSDHRDEFA
jgi:hypothetical protein